MSRAPCTFRIRDVHAALKAATKAGIKVQRYELDREGKIVVFAVTDKTNQGSFNDISNEWDKVN
jgi:putative NADPH-quinone reductase